MSVISNCTQSLGNSLNQSLASTSSENVAYFSERLADLLGYYPDIKLVKSLLLEINLADYVDNEQQLLNRFLELESYFSH